MNRPSNACRGGVRAGGVGSKVVQPRFGNQASTQLWASEARITYHPLIGLRAPPSKPVASREGMPRVRSMIANAEAKYSQYPLRRSKRKLANGSAVSLGGSSRVYSKLA